MDIMTETLTASSKGESTAFRVLGENPLCFKIKESSFCYRPPQRRNLLRTIKFKAFSTIEGPSVPLGAAPDPYDLGPSVPTDKPQAIHRLSKSVPRFGICLSIGSRWEHWACIELFGMLNSVEFGASCPESARKKQSLIKLQVLVTSTVP